MSALYIGGRETRSSLDVCEVGCHFDDSLEDGDEIEDEDGGGLDELASCRRDFTAPLGIDYIIM